jgi:hypothetical protein
MLATVLRASVVVVCVFFAASSLEAQSCSGGDFGRLHTGLPQWSVGVRIGGYPLLRAPSGPSGLRRGRLADALESATRVSAAVKPSRHE